MVNDVNIPARGGSSAGVPATSEVAASVSAMEPAPLRPPQFSVLKHDGDAGYEPLFVSSALILGDAHGVLSVLPEGCAQTVITSPPYWSLRDYAISGQVGLEASVYDFIDALADLFDEVRRVLRDDGTLWLNMGTLTPRVGEPGALPTRRMWRAQCRRALRRLMV